MGFSWGTFLAQILNLFVLIWLMKRFLYTPIINAISKRQAYIEGKVKSADNAVLSAKEQEKALAQKVIKWDTEKKKRTDELFGELSQIKQEQLDKLSQESEKAHLKMQDDLNREATSLTIEIRNMIASHFCQLSRQVLTDLSGLAPMEQAVLLCQKKIKSYSKSEIDDIKKSNKKQNVIQIYSSETLDKKTQENMTAFLTKNFALKPEQKIRFSVNSDLILGIEILIGESIIEWNLRTYLDTFENNLNTTLSGLIIKGE